MARMIGIDLGSHSVKIAVVEAGFRATSLVSLQTLEVDRGVEPALERSLAALPAEAELGENDGVVVGMPGDRVLLRLLDIPFADPRKLHAVVANELADDVPWDLDEVIFDYAALPAGLQKVVAGAARSSELQQLLGRLSGAGVDPRHLAVAPLSYAEVVRRIHPGGTLAVVDLGHMRSNVCLIRDGRSLMARTISRGGHQLTEALRQALHLSYGDAEEVKLSRALVAADPEQLPPAEQRLAAVTARALAPLVRELRQTIDVLAGRIGAEPEMLLLCGGTSLLRGIDEHLSVELGTAAARLSFAGDPELRGAGLSEEGEAIGALSLGLALEHGRRPLLDLRRGPFAFKVDRSFLRDKLWALAGAVVAILICAALSAYAQLHALRSDQALLERQLERQTRQVFGEVRRNPAGVSRELRRGSRPASSGIPDKTAVDVLDTLSRRLPAEEGVQIDVTRLDIKPGKVYLKGTANSQSTVGEMVKALKGDECFGEVSSGKVSTVGDGKKQFTITASSKCY